MADVLTNRLRATKPDVGGSDDTWGSKLNTDWDIIDRVYRDLSGALVTSTFGSSNAHETSLTHDDYADIDSTLGFRIALRSGATNTGDMTLNVNDGNGARAVRKFENGVQAVLDAGDFPLHYVGDFVYIRRSSFSGWILINPATGVVKPPPAASETVVGVTRYATNLEAQNETLATVAITPKNLAAIGGTVLPDATTTVKGKVELATAAEVETGTDAVRAVTPASIPYADTNLRGLVRLATSAETIAGTDTVNVITPSRLQAALDDHAPDATTGVRGIIEIATNAEALEGTDATKAITSDSLTYATAARTTRDNQLVQHSNLVVTRTGADTVHIVAQGVLLQRTGDAAPRRFTSIVETANINTLGAGGRDVGAINNDAWYAIHIIAKEDGTVSSLLTLVDGGTGVTGGAPGSNPTLPSGYVYWGYVGSVRNNAGNFVNFVQCGNVASITGPALAISVANNEWHTVTNFPIYVPPEALSVRVSINGSGAAADTLSCFLAPFATVNTTGTGSFGEVLLQSIGPKVTGQVTLGITDKQTIYVRVANGAAGDPVTDCDIYVNGYTL